jgi:hypothetical protein
MTKPLVLDLNNQTPGTSNDSSVTPGLGYTDIFGNAVLTGSGPVSEVLLANVESGVKFAFSTGGSTSIEINGDTFNLVHSGTTWTIDATSAASNSTWDSVLDDLHVKATMSAQLGTDHILVGAIGDSSSAAAVENLTICFYRGTLVRTPAGDVAVETLKHGDLVLTHDGREVPVAWLGRQTVSTVFSDKLRVLPIRIKAGALGENVPARDLLVSPDHAMFVDGVLIHAGALVNDTSITRESNVPSIFTYFHVEVADHSLILAEGAPAETFVDNVDRLGFDNWNEYEALYPEGKTVEEMPYPRAKARRQVPVSIRVALAARAEAIGAVAEAAVA